MKGSYRACPHCLEDFYVAPKRRRVFCSMKCRKEGKKNSRHSYKYRKWRKLVFQRDGYTCQECGQVGGVLNADHIKPWALFPELRFELDNGRTLCVKCHKDTDTYGVRFGESGVTREDLLGEEDNEDLHQM